MNDRILSDTSLTGDPNQDRRKRRRTESPQPSVASSNSVQPVGELRYDRYHSEAGSACILSADTEIVPETAPNTDTLMADAPPPQNDSPLPTITTIANSVHSDTCGTAVDCEHVAALPKKQIKVTKTGKLVSSPPESESQLSGSTRTRRGRKPKLTKANQPSTITVIRYGSDTSTKLSLGQRIDAILNGKPSKKHAAAPKKAAPKPTGPPKPTHPFFSGKPDQRKDEKHSASVAEQAPPNLKKSAVTPGKLQAETRREQSSGPVPAFGISSRNSRSSRQAGLVEPPWPAKDWAHVRNLDDGDATRYRRMLGVRDSILKPRKLKTSTASLSVRNDMITKLSQQLKPNTRKTDLFDCDFAPPEDVRLPTRLLTTGLEVQHRVREQVRAQLSWPGEKDRDYGKIHPAIVELFNGIEHTLTPFDKGECESQTWTQKYGPKCASHVLQSGTEATILKDWLQSLTVMAVGGSHTNQKSNGPADGRKPPKKKRKTVEDSFIVSDDEEEEMDLVELSHTSSANAHQPRSLRRPVWKRNQNVVLISGPHGCGKSATVYAVAKELDFEVFEINSGVRRSGKDIQDKVGDMTANHLVNHRRSGAPMEDTTAPSTTAEDTDNERLDDEFQKDLDSGKQGTMTSFFKAGIATKSKPKAESKIAEPKKPTAITAQATLPITQAMRKSQKQSLILIEEADVLFEEDQHFWAYVTKLASQSKRPIVITCNDELQIPAHDLPLGAILRLSPPPTSLATDYLLVLAGREGHILDRQAVQDLYESKQQDLRASITELDFWCQISVGDRKGGLEWMYQRWPPGKDVDINGRLLRVASEGTYQTGMGWLSHNVFESTDNISFDKENELLQETWQDWTISPDQWNRNSKTRDSPILQKGNAQGSQLEALDKLSILADIHSAADVYCRVGLPSYDRMYDQPIDPTVPPMVVKDRLNYTIAASVLHAEAQTDFLNFDTSISVETELLARRVFPNLAHSPSTSPPSVVESETQYSKHILDLRRVQNTECTLSRSDYSNALDILATPEDHIFPERTSFMLTPSSFDREFGIITLDLAPYIRSIVNHELTLETQRVRLGNLLSEGGQLKRPRNTRASRTALEGGSRQAKRRERWFPPELDFDQVLKTAGRSWAGLGWKGENTEEESGSLTGTLESMDGAQELPEVMSGRPDQG
jgi:DNA polymerase III delta prime subunit